eukprot:765132-Rhodomonas_salina.1
MVLLLLPDRGGVYWQDGGGSAMGYQSGTKRRVYYEKSGTERRICYGKPGTALRPCYQKSGTELGCAASRSGAGEVAVEGGREEVERERERAERGLIGSVRILLESGELSAKDAQCELSGTDVDFAATHLLGRAQYAGMLLLVLTPDMLLPAGSGCAGEGGEERRGGGRAVGGAERERREEQ